MSAKLPGLLIFLILTLTLLTACGSDPAATPTPALPTPTVTPILTATSTLNPTPTVVPQNWKYNWLRGIPCNAPCWEGITPGKTTLDEAIEIIKKLPFVSSYTIDYYGINFNWIHNNVQGIAYINANQPTRVISYIIPFRTFRYKLGDIISVYGEPTHIVAKAVNYGAIVGHSLLLFWLKDGFALRNPIDGTLPTLDTATMLEGFGVITPDIEGVNNYFVGAKYDIRPWEGFKDFNYYCIAIGFYANPDCSKILKATP